MRRRRFPGVAAWALAALSAPAVAPAQPCAEVADHLHIEARLPRSGSLWQAARNGTTLWIARSGSALESVDVTNPADPQPIAELPLSTNPSGFAIRGDHGFVAKSTPDFLSGELLTVDLSNPASPQILATTGFPVVGNHLKVVGDRMYAAGDALRIYDVSDPLTPTLLGSYTGPGFIARFDVEGNLAYLPSFAFGIRIVDVSDPANITLVGGTAPLGEFLCVDVVGNIAYAGNRVAGLFTYDVADPANCALLGFTPFRENDVYETVHVEGSHAFVTNAWVGCDVIDVSNPAAPIRTGRVRLGNGADGLFVDLPYVYALEPADLWVLDATEPSSVPPVVHFDTPGEARAVALDGDIAFVADNFEGVRAYDVSNLAAPQFLGSYTVGTAVSQIAASPGRVYFRDLGAGGITALDVSNPATPAFLSAHPAASVADFEAVGNLLYVTGSAGLQVLDYSDPLLPTVIGTYPTAGNSTRFARRGTLVFLEDDAVGLLALDLQDPTNPTYLGEFAVDDVDDVATLVNLVLVGSSQNGLTVIDAQDPAAMTLRSTVPGSYWRVAAAGTHAYASGFNTMVFDLSDPGAPVALGNLDHGSVPQSLTIGNGLLWSAEFSDGVTALPLQCVPTSLVSAASPASFALMPPQPNPFRDEATVAFSLLRASVVTISIHDVAGRLVRDWPTAHREAGAHQLRWDGRDAGGRPSGSGVYFVRLSSSDGTRTAKVTLLQ